ncbi:hypothetical protein DMN91_006014 [Ooceraea biroi]|uniref:VWFC domain-containing protein n=1 Tax=Ooceraea biroi TaxID=2015173 RepID=A0A3L8DP37_OOCBI|nr:titin [Ooceraea biroi]RLU21639.1 hypothetical protein DMN91_006014 [Ooceraea biroi]
MSALNAAPCRRGIILWLAAVLLLASRSTHSAPVYDQDTTQIAEYDGAVTGCYFNFQRYQEGDRIITSEPCLNCTCHNRMLMCYLKVCPFTKAIGQDCTVEKRPDQCCPVITCPEVPVQLLTSTTSAPAISDSTDVGFHDNYGCHVDERFYPDGAMLPVEHHNPCELCYCIRNRTTCVMQECTLRVAGCKPVYQPGVCCPIKYNCEYDEEPSTTVGPTPGLIMTTTLPPGMLPQCFYEGKIYEDGDLIYSTQPCQHCYCFRGEIACAVQNCGTPMEAHGKNCTALPPPEGECCPTTYQCEEGEQGTITLPEEGEEQLPEQVAHDLEMTESPMVIDQEDQQVKGEHPQQEAFPGADNVIPQVPEEEEEGVHGTIEHVTQGHIPSTEKPEEPKEQAATLPTEENVVPETETTEKESIPSHEHVTETSPAEMASEEVITAKVPSETEVTKTEAPTTMQEIETATEAPAVELPGATSQGPHPEEETVTTEPEKHASTEKSEIEKEQSTEPSVSEEIQTEGVIKTEPEVPTSPHEGFSTQVPEEVTEKATEEEQVSTTKAPEQPEISTEIIEKVTSPVAEIEEPSVSIVPEHVTEQEKEDESKVETTPGEIQAAEIPSELPVEQPTATMAHEIPSIEQAATEKGEVSHPTETAVIEEAQTTEVSGHPEEPSTQQEQKPVAGEGEEEQRPEQPTSEHAIIEGDLTESPAMGEEPITTEKQHVEKEITPEIPAQGPTGIPIPERSPEQKAEDENVYHVTEDYRDVTRPEISPDNLMTELPQKTSEASPPQEQEATPTPSEETEKPILEEATEVTLSSQTESKPEIVETSTSTEKTKAESTSAVTEIQASTESSATTIKEHVPEEKAPEEAPSSEELPMKGLGVEESEEISGEQVEKEVHPKKELSSEEEPSVATQPVPETSSSIPAEHEQSTEPGEEQTSEGEHVTTVIPSVEQSTHAKQDEEKETETVPIEEEKAVTSEKPIERVTGESVEKSTTQKPTIEESKTEQPKEYFTEKAPEEVTVTENHDVQETKAPEKKPEEIEGPKGVSPEGTEEPTEATVTEKELPKETEERKPTEVTGIEQTELPAIEEHPTKLGEIEKEGEEKISVPASTEETGLAIETESTKVPAEEQQTEEMHTEPSASKEHLPSQPSIPSDRKEDQEPVEPKPSEEEKEIQEQITQKPSLEEIEVTKTQEEPQQPNLLSETEGTHIPSSEETVTEGTLPEEKPGEAATQSAVERQPEIVSEQPKEVTTELSGQEEQTQIPIIEEQPEIHIRKETEPPGIVTPEEPSLTPSSAVSEGPVTGEKGADVSKSTEAAISEGTTISVSISEVSTVSPELEEHTEHEGTVPIEKEIVTEFTPSEKEQPEVTHPLTTEEKPSKESGEAEIIPPEVYTEETISETPEIPVIEQHPHEPEEVPKETITETPIHKEHEEHSTIAPEEIPEVKITTEVPLKEVPQDSTEHPTSTPEKTSVEEETTSEIVPRPLGIPGEGNCLVEGQSYNNNSAVPPANICQTSCRCISSIVQCELVECPAPPVHLSNCMPVHTGGESCCPMYACDSTPTAELESDSHMVQPHTPEAEEGKEGVPSTEVSTEAPAAEVTEAAKEPSIVTDEIHTPESQPATEVAIPSISPSEEAGVTEIKEQQTTLKPIEPVYEQTTIGQPIKQHEEHTISSVPETSQEPEEHTQLPGESTESKVSEEEEGVTKVPTEQPQEEIVIPVSGGEVITSTESHSAEKQSSTVSHKEEETHIPVEITTIAAGKEKTTISIKEQEMPTKEISIKEQSTPESVETSEETGKEQPITSEEPSTVEEHETPTKLEVPVLTEEPVKSELPEKQQPVEPTEYETTSVSEIQSTITHKPEEGQEIITSSEGEQITQTEKSESDLQTKVPETETQGPIVSTPESTTFILHDHTVTELPLNHVTDHVTVKSMEVSTEESKEEESEVSTKVPGIEEEHVTIPIKVEVPSEGITEQELEKPTEETVKPAQESTSEIPHKEILPETIGSTESAAGTTEHVEEHPEPSLAEHEEEPSVTKLSEEKPIEPEIPVSTEQPVKAVEEASEAELEKTTKPTVAHEFESTQVSVEEHPEVTSETESHEPELSVQEHTTIGEETITFAPAQEELGEHPITSIIKETEPSLSEAETEQPIVSEVESEAPVVEHVTVTTEEQTPKSEEHPIEEQTASPVPSKDETTEGAVLEETSESVTSQKEQVTEKPIESAKPETEVSNVTEEQTVAPEVQKGVEEEEQQKPEGITEEIGKEQPVPEVTEVGHEGTTEETVKEEVTSILEEHTSVEEHPEQEVTPSEMEPGVKVEPMKPETTSGPIEEKPKEEGEVSEAPLPEQPTSEEATIASLIPEEHPTVSTETKEKESTEKPEYQTTLSTAEEEVSKPATEASEVEKLSPEEESATAEVATVKPEQPATIVPVEVSPTEKPAEVLPETERPTVSEQETASPEQQGETTTKAIETAITEEEIPEEKVPVETILEEEEKPSEAPEAGVEEETHPSVPVETTPIHEEEEPSITKLQPTEEPLPSEGETLVPEIQPSQSEEGEVTYPGIAEEGEHPGVPEEGHPISGIPEEPQFTTEHAAEVPVTIKEEEHPETEQSEISSEVPMPTEGPIKVSGTPIELPEEQITVRPVPSEEPIPEVPTRPEESTETSVEQHVIKVPAELPTAETPEEIPEEEVVHPQEGVEIGHPHIDHFPEVTMRPEPDYSELTFGSDEEHLRPVNHTEVTKRPYQPGFHEQQPTTLAPHIPEYPDQIVSGEDNPHFPVQGGSYLNHDEDYDEDDQVYGPGTCRYGGKVYVSAQQIPRDDPCDFCFCFRSDIICLQQSCPPPIPGCHEEPISGFCCPRYECPVSMATALNLTTTTTTTTTTLPPHFPAHAYKGAARRNGCQISGKTYRVGEVIKSASGPCLHCTCGGDGNMKCDPRICTPEPMLRQMIAAVAAERRRR